MKKAFLSDASIYFTVSGKITSGPIQIIFDMVEGKPSPSKMIHTISFADISGNIATVQLVIASWVGHAFIDMLTMIRDGGGRKTARKAFHRL